MKIINVIFHILLLMIFKKHYILDHKHKLFIINEIYFEKKDCLKHN